MTEIIVEARTIITGVQDRHTPIIHDNAAVLVRDGIIVEVGDPAALRSKAPDATVHRYPRHVMLPGFVNSHHHVGLTPLQLGSPDHALELWFATRIAAKRVDHELDTLYSAFEMLASGVTTVQHIHGWMAGGYAQVHGAASQVLGAYRKIGMRASYCYAVREQNRLVYEADEAFCERLPQPVAGQLMAHLKAQSMPFADFLTLFETLKAENEGERLTGSSWPRPTCTGAATRRCRPSMPPRASTACPCICTSSRPPIRRNMPGAGPARPPCGTCTTSACSGRT